jgi:uncharacterized membrane protein
LKPVFRDFSGFTVFAAIILLIFVCIFYGAHAYNTPPNSDERASLVIALGRHPSLTDAMGTPILFDAYIDSLNYKRYPVSGSSFTKTIQSVVKDNSNGLLYYLALTAWIKLFGLNIFLIRLLSVFIAVVNLGLLYRLAKSLGIRNGLCFLIILQMAINPVFFEDAILIRSYMLALMGCLVSVSCVFKISMLDSPPRKYFLFYFLGILIAISSHYYTFSLLGGITVFLISKSKRGMHATIIWGYTILFFMMAAWIWYIYPTALNTLNFFKNRFYVISKGTGYTIHFLNAVRQLLLYSANMFGITSDIKMLSIFFKILSGLLICLLIGRIFLRRSDIRYQFMFAVTLLPLILFLMQSFLVGNFFNFIPHYLVFFIPFWCLLLYLEIENRCMYIQDSND